MDDSSKELKKQLERMNRAQLAEFIKKKHIVIEDLENSTKKEIISKILYDIDFREFWRDYYS